MDNKRSQNETSRGRHAETTGDQVERIHVEAFTKPSEGARTRAYANYSTQGHSSGYAAAYVGRRRKHPLKVLGIMVLVVALILAVVYVAGAFYFQDRFYPNTTIGAANVSLMSEDEAEQELSEAIADYTLTISGQGFSLKLTAEEAALDVDERVVVRDAAAENDPWRWPLQVLGEHDCSEYLVTASDEELLRETVTAAVEEFNDSEDEPVDAAVSYDEESGAFAVQAEQAGTTLDAQAVADLAVSAVVDLERRVELSSDVLEQPSVLSDDERLTSAADEANAMLACSVTLVLQDAELAVLDGSQVVEWVTLSDDYAVTLDAQALAEWVEDLAADWDTVGTTRTYTRADGKECTVTGGDWGWSVDADALVAAVQEAVAAGSVEAIEVPCASEGEEYAGAGERDWGARYVDVDLTEQHVYFYDEEGELVWESDCVSGALEDDRETPTGVYSINMKESPSVLVGYDDDGEVSYESNVTYWMPFSGNSVGLHDATWQSAFGGTRYKDGYGSHGCVNLPLEEAGELYELIEVGDVVVVHW